MKPGSVGTVAVCAMLTLPLPTAAQIPMTLKGGLNLTSFVGGDAEATEQVRGLNLGASFGLFHVSRVQLAAEVYYRQKGAVGSLGDLESLAGSGAVGPPAQKLEVGLDYVEIPVLARIHLGTASSSWFPYLFGGPAFGWRVDCGVAFGDESGEPETDCDDLTSDFEDTLRRYETGLVVGGGLDYALPRGIGAINLDARYTGGLTRIGQGEEALDIRNQAFTVMLGWTFGMPGLGGGGPAVQPR